MGWTCAPDEMTGQSSFLRRANRGQKKLWWSKTAFQRCPEKTYAEHRDLPGKLGGTGPAARGLKTVVAAVEKKHQKDYEKAHERRHCSIAAKDFVCSKCHRCCISRAGLLAHMRAGLQ